MSYLSQAFDGILDYGWRIFYASMIFFVAELLWAHNRYSWRSRLRGAMFWLSYIIITVLFFTWFNQFWRGLGIEPLFKLQLGWLASSPYPALKVAGWILISLLAAILGEFFYYWFHRAQHRYAWLWAFHSEHHALREMSAWNSNHHFSEEILRIPFITLPLTLLVQVDTGYIPVLIILLLGLQGQYEHSHTRLHLGPLRYLIADNRFHRIHHSVEAQHHNKNFGSFSSVWDQVFGTAHFPARHEWPDTGIAEHDEAKTLNDYLLRPFRKLLGKNS